MDKTYKMTKEQYDSMRPHFQALDFHKNYGVWPGGDLSTIKQAYKEITGEDICNHCGRELDQIISRINDYKAEYEKGILS